MKNLAPVWNGDVAACLVRDASGKDVIIGIKHVVNGCAAYRALTKEELKDPRFKACAKELQSRLEPELVTDEKRNRDLLAQSGLPLE